MARSLKALPFLSNNNIPKGWFEYFKYGIITPLTLLTALYADTQEQPCEIRNSGPIRFFFTK